MITLLKQRCEEKETTLGSINIRPLRGWGNVLARSMRFAAFRNSASIVAYPARRFVGDDTQSVTTFAAELMDQAAGIFVC